MTFRSINVDALDEDILVENDLFYLSNGVEIDPETALSEVQKKGVEVKNLLNRQVLKITFIREYQSCNQCN